jgi:hypothetical protein
MYYMKLCHLISFLTSIISSMIHNQPFMISDLKAKSKTKFKKHEIHEAVSISIFLMLF